MLQMSISFSRYEHFSSGLELVVLAGFVSDIYISDTLIKLMEYGDDDDEPEETSQELFKRKSNSAVTPKPFWAV